MNANMPAESGTCSVPMTFPEGVRKCTRPAYGPQPESSVAGFKHDTEGLVCPFHGGPALSDVIAGYVVIRFDGPPGHTAGRFVEVERDGASIDFGVWVQDFEDWLLVLPKYLLV